MKNNSKFAPYPVRLAYENTGLSRFLPATMAEHVRNGGTLYVVEPPTAKSVFISTHADPIGHLCTFVDSAAVIRT